MPKYRNLDTVELHRLDNKVVHPWDTFAVDVERHRPIIKRAEGVYIFDSDGNRYLDGPAGMWCVNVGYGRTEIAQAMFDQSMQMAYSSPWFFGNYPASTLADRLAQYSPGDLNHVLFTSGGSEAVDSALRFIAFYNNCVGRPEKKHIISRDLAYHGSTYLSASACGMEQNKRLVDTERSWIHHIGAPHAFRRPKELSVEAFLDAKIEELEDKIIEIGPNKVAAFIAEPVQASGGVIVAPDGYHKRCLEICRKYDVLYISDEVVTAFGRLGHNFASEAVFGITPDIITVAKGITSGYVPLGAALISDRLINDITTAGQHEAMFTHGFTYSGHPVACAVAHKTLDIIEEENILDHVRSVAPYFQSRLRELEDIPIVGEARGIGLMACVECVIEGPNGDKETLNAEIGKRIDEHCQKLGLIVRPSANLCIMSPALIITDSQIDELVDNLRTGIELAMKDFGL